MHLILAKFIIQLKHGKLEIVCVKCLQHSLMDFGQVITLVNYGLTEHLLQGVTCLTTTCPKRAMLTFLVISLILCVLYVLWAESQSTCHFFASISSHWVTHMMSVVAITLSSLLPVSVELSKEQPGSIILSLFIEIKKIEIKQRQKWIHNLIFMSSKHYIWYHESWLYKTASH